MNALVVIALLAAAVWTAVIFLRGGLLGGCLLVLFAACLLGQPFYSLHVGLLPLTVDRVLWVVLLVVYVVQRRTGLVERKPLSRADVVLCALSGVLLLSLFSHHWQAHGFQPLARLTLAYLMPFGLYWVARQVRLSERSVLVMFGCLGALALYLAVTALGEVNQWWWLVYPKYIGSAEYAEFMGRARGPLLNPVGSGLLQGVCLAGLLMCWPRLGRPGRAVLLIGALAVGLGVYFTLTRSVWMGAALGLCVLLGLALPRSWRLPVLASFLIVVLVAGATQWGRVLAFKRDRDLSAQATLRSVQLRPVLAVVAWNMFRDHPLAGCGFGQYMDRSGEYLADRSSGLDLETARPFAQHNVFLSLLVETGLLGTGLFVALLALWLRDAWRLWRSPGAPRWARQVALLLLVALANYVANGMFHDLSLIFAVHTFLFFLAGVTAGLRHYAYSAAASPVPVQSAPTPPLDHSRTPLEHRAGRWGLGAGNWGPKPG